jgi:LuxR family transcriptional regulator, quorum-sensing system regulator CinR
MNLETACAALPDLLRRIEALRHLDDMKPLLSDVAALFGCGHAHYAIRRSLAPQDPGVLRFTTLPQALMEKYLLETAWEYDPIYQHMMQSVMPICCTEADWSDRKSAELREWLAVEGASPSGLAVSVHGPCGLTGMLRLMASSTTSPWEGCRIEAKSMLSLCAAQLFETAKRLSDTSDFVVVSISRREAECLDWSAKGKTIAETAMILGLAPTTVRHALDDARMKLGAATKSQAVARAQELRLLSV